MSAISVTRTMICKAQIKQYHGPVPIVTKKYPYTFHHFRFITSKFMNFIGEEQLMFTSVGLLQVAPYITNWRNHTHTYKLLIYYQISGT
jgi:hypothetical protein